MYKILIVEDHALIRFGLKTAFETKEFISDIYEADNAQDAYNIVKKTHIDAVIMDLGLPDTNGIEASREINRINKDIKIIILTSHNSEQEVSESIKAGARAYCSKDINPDRLAHIVNMVMDGALWFDPKVADTVLNLISAPKKNVKIKDDYNLTDREHQVLQYICDGLNNTEISKLLDVSINTVKVHVSSIIQKLGVDDRTQVVVKALNK